MFRHNLVVSSNRGTAAKVGTSRCSWYRKRKRSAGCNVYSVPCSNYQSLRRAKIARRLNFCLRLWIVSLLAREDTSNQLCFESKLARQCRRIEEYLMNLQSATKQIIYNDEYYLQCNTMILIFWQGGPKVSSCPFFFLYKISKYKKELILLIVGIMGFKIK